MKNINTIILAAGKGTRMKSSKPKVLQTLGGKTLLEHALSVAQKISDKTFVVYGSGGKQIKQALKGKNINLIKQEQQLGTGHAVQQVMPYIKNNLICVILYGDVPLIREKTLNDLISKAKKTGLSLLSVELDNPKGYGRIIRDNGKIKVIVEHKDANKEQLKISEVNSGIMAVDSGLLKKYLNKIDTNNIQSELYLTDIVKIATNDNKEISSVITKNKSEVAGVNDKVQLSNLERIFQQEQADKFMQRGLTIKDSKRFDCRGNLTFGKDCEVDVNVVFIGDVSLGDNVKILPNCVIEDANIRSGAIIGPFAHLRLQTDVGEDVKIGNFVETKKSKIGKGSKISHLSYIGDALIGRDVNIGAGVITCNYDGINKHQTIIKDGVFVGSDTQLIAPVTIGKDATIGAGSTITKNCEENQLTLSRNKQNTIKNWRKPIKNSKS